MALSSKTRDVTYCVEHAFFLLDVAARETIGSDVRSDARRITEDTEYTLCLSNAIHRSRRYFWFSTNICSPSINIP